MELWFTELQEKGLRLGFKVKDVLFKGRSQYQEVCVYDTVTYGRALMIDDVVMTTEKDEFVYHEMLVHVPMMAHPRPERVLVIGGGDGGAIREVVKHPSVRFAHLVEIDQMVIEASRKYLPQISLALADPRVKITVGDGIEYLKTTSDRYDVIIVDSTDPVGAATGLFAEDFYRSVRNALRPGGIHVSQTESPWFYQELIGQIAGVFRKIFPVYSLYLATVPTYPGNMWSFSMGSLEHSGDIVAPDRYAALGCKYYTPEVHAASMVLPKFVQDMIKEDPPRGVPGEAVERPHK